MFCRDSSVRLSAGSPSLIPNNLASTLAPSGFVLSYIQRNEVYLSSASGECSKISVTKSKVFQTQFVELHHGTVVLAVLSNIGVQLWSLDGENMLFYYAIKSLRPIEIDEDLFMRGVTVVQESLCVGLSNGLVAVFKCSARCFDANDFPLSHKLNTDKAAVMSLSSSDSTMVAADENGKLFGFDARNAFESAFSFPSYGYPCTCTCQKGSLLYAGYSTGHIRIFRTDIKEMAIEIAAHRRCITGLALHPRLNLLCSCAQDQVINIWNVPNFQTRAESVVALAHSEVVENRMCTGIAFLDSDRICVTTYDDDELVILQKSV